MSERYWIKGAIGKKGSLRETTRRRYGEKGFTERGRIKKKYLREMSKEKGVTGRRSRLALTLGKMRRQ